MKMWCVNWLKSILISVMGDHFVSIFALNGETRNEKVGISFWLTILRWFILETKTKFVHLSMSYPYSLLDSTKFGKPTERFSGNSLTGPKETIPSVSHGDSFAW